MMRMLRRTQKRIVAISIVWKVAILFTLAIVFAVGSSEWIPFRDSKKLLLNAAVRSMDESMTLQIERMTAAIGQIRDDARMISKTDAVAEYLHARAAVDSENATGLSVFDLQRRLERDFAVMMNVRGYQQIRLIGLDDSGHELVRVDRDLQSDHFVKNVRGDELQSKGTRDYVLAGGMLEPDQTYVSSITLNREHGAIEEPRRPTLRVVAPVYQAVQDSDSSARKRAAGGDQSETRVDGGQVKKPRAVLVINVNADAVLSMIEQSESVRGIIVNDTGGILKHPDSDLEWGFEFDTAAPASRESKQFFAWQQENGRQEAVVWDAENQEVYAFGRVHLDDNKRYLGLIMTRRKKDVLAAVSQLWAITVCVSLAAIAISSGLCAAAVYHLIRPIGVLTAQTDMLMEGDENVRFTVTGDDEIGRLGRSFSNLVDRLKDRRDEAECSAEAIRFLNASLEQKIEDRTAALAQSEAYVRAVLMSAPDAIISIDAHGTVLDYNPAAERTFGFLSTEIIGQNVTMFIPESFREQHKQGLARFRGGGQLTMLGKTIEIVGLRKDDTEFPMELTIEKVRGIERHLFTAIVRDITARKQDEQVLRENARAVAEALGREKEAVLVAAAEKEKYKILATTDKLTGLANRRVFLERLKQVHKVAKEDGHRFAVLFFDFDRFKVVNDCLGHVVGDALLFDIAGIFQSALQEGDMVARFGGDEFVVLLDDLSEWSQARAKAEEFLCAFAKPHMLGENRVVSTASIGMVTSDRDYESASDMIRDADAAMYLAKDLGKNRVVEFDDLLRKKALDRLELEQGLRTAADDGQLFLVYQPIIELETGRLTGFEALVRWDHPERGLIRPDEFIQIAEDTGLIVDMGLWILRTAAKQITDWNRRLTPEQSLTMNVNVSKVQLFEKSYLEDVLECKRGYGLRPGEIKLEITESTIAYNSTSVIPLLRTLREHGFPIVMDDFGTGVSSLSVLHEYPIDVLKIDQAFIRSLDKARSFLAVVSSITSLAQNLGISTVAEGIESEDIVGALQSIDCKWGQGYYFAKPLTAKDAEAFILDHHEKDKRRAA